MYNSNSYHERNCALPELSTYCTVVEAHYTFTVRTYDEDPLSGRVSGSYCTYARYRAVD